MTMYQKDLIELLGKKTKEINTIIENKETLTNKEIIKIVVWMGQAMLLIEIFKKTDTDAYNFLKKLSENEIKTTIDIKNAISKFNTFIKHKNLFTQPYPTPVEIKKDSYWNKV